MRHDTEYTTTSTVPVPITDWVAKWDKPIDILRLDWRGVFKTPSTCQLFLYADNHHVVAWDIPATDDEWHFQFNPTPNMVLKTPATNFQMYWSSPTGNPVYARDFKWSIALLPDVIRVR